MKKLIARLFGKKTCQGEIIQMQSPSEEIDLYACSDCGDWYIDVRGKPVAEGGWSDLATKGVEIADRLRSEGFPTAASELQAIALSAGEYLEGAK